MSTKVTSNIKMYQYVIPSKKISRIVAFSTLYMKQRRTAQLKDNYNFNK